MRRILAGFDAKGQGSKAVCDLAVKSKQLSMSLNSGPKNFWPAVTTEQSCIAQDQAERFAFDPSQCFSQLIASRIGNISQEVESQMNFAERDSSYRSSDRERSRPHGHSRSVGHRDRDEQTRHSRIRGHNGAFNSPGGSELLSPAKAMDAGNVADAHALRFKFIVADFACPERTCRFA